MNVTEYAKQAYEFGGQIGSAADEFASKDFLPSLSKDSDKQQVGIAGFKAYSIVDRKVTLNSTSPDFVTEDGATKNDTIFRSPLRVSISGVVSDIYIDTSPQDNILTRAETVIGETSQFLPVRSASQISKVRDIIDQSTNIARKISSSIDSAKLIYDQFLGTDDAETLQEQFIKVMSAIYNQGMLIPIETEFGLHRDMMIESFETTTNAQSGEIKFTIAAKQLRFAETIVTRVTAAKNPSSGVGGALGDSVDKGTTQGEKKSSSFASTIVGFF